MDDINTGQKSLVCLYSDSNFLALSILENLLARNCFINIFSDDAKGWQEKISHLSGSRRLTILPQVRANNFQTSGYAIFLGGFIKGDEAYEECAKFLKTGIFQNSKTLLIFPFEVFDSAKNSLIPVNDNLGVIYLGDLLGARFDLRSDLLMSRLLNEILIDKSVTFGIGEILYPIFVTDAARTISRWLFSFGPYGKEIFLLGKDVSPNAFWGANGKLVGSLKIFSDDKLQTRTRPRSHEVKRINCDLNFSLTETYRWFSVAGTGESRIITAFKKTPELQSGDELNADMSSSFRGNRRPESAEDVIKGKKISTVKKKTSHKYPKYLSPLAVFFTAILLFPFLMLFGASASFYLSYRQLVRGGTSDNFILAAKTFSLLGSSESKILEKIPLIGAVYKETAFAGEVGLRLSDLSLNFSALANTEGEMFGKVLGDKVYDPLPLSSQMKSNLNYIYQGVSFLEADAKAARESGVAGASILLNRIDLERIKRLTREGEVLSDRLPVLLGKDQRKTYLVLFENNMELRPTGGFIGSFGLLTFDGGRLSDMVVSDVYSADGQLNGHVEPPPPIKNYLGEANWWLRDSNWDPDFPTSAKRAEWFLDKELGQDVNGVIAIDLKPIKDLLRYTGPIFLADYNLNISDKNLYETTQSEVQDNFFPGTHKKASFLSALSKNLTSEIAKVIGGEKLGILKVVFENLEERHIQLFLHDSAQNAISSLGWDGAVSLPSCGEGCRSDFAGVVEANLGVNKANYFITRSVGMNVNTNGSKIDRELTLKLSNSANSALGTAGKYKVYVRLIIPQDSDVRSVKTISGQSEATLSPEISDNKQVKEVGVLLEVLGGTSKEIEFSWSSASARDTNYGLYFRKQGGIESYPFTLTLNGQSIYNSNLAKDLWIQKP